MMNVFFLIKIKCAQDFRFSWYHAFPEVGVQCLLFVPMLAALLETRAAPPSACDPF